MKIVLCVAIALLSMLSATSATSRADEAKPKTEMDFVASVSDDDFVSERAFVNNTREELSDSAEGKAALAAFLKMNAANRVKRAQQLVDDVDRIVFQFRLGKISLPEAVKQISDPGLLKNTGFVIRPKPPNYKLIAEPTEADASIWHYDVVSGGSAPLFLDGEGAKAKYIIAGFIMIELAQIQNGHDLNDPFNRPVLIRLLHAWAEELYHTAQFLKNGSNTPSGNLVISQYFKERPEVFKQELTRPRVEAPVRPFECDVYAKLLEVFGVAGIPAYYEATYQEDRVFVDRAKIQDALPVLTQ